MSGLSKSPGSVGLRLSRWGRALGAAGMCFGSGGFAGRSRAAERVYSDNQHENSHPACRATERGFAGFSGVWVGAWPLSRRGAHGDESARSRGAPSGVSAGRPVRAARGSGWRRAPNAVEWRSGGSPGGYTRSGRSRARWRPRRWKAPRGFAADAPPRRGSGPRRS